MQFISELTRLKFLSAHACVCPYLCTAQFHVNGLHHVYGDRCKSYTHRHSVKTQRYTPKHLKLRRLALRKTKKNCLKKENFNVHLISIEVRAWRRQWSGHWSHWSLARSNLFAYPVLLNSCTEVRIILSCVCFDKTIRLFGLSRFTEHVTKQVVLWTVGLARKGLLIRT